MLKHSNLTVKLKIKKKNPQHMLKKIQTVDVYQILIISIMERKLDIDDRESMATLYSKESVSEGFLSIKC